MSDNNENDKENNVEEKEDEVKWEPVAKLDVKEEDRDPYAYAPESVREFHRSYVEFWLEGKKAR